MNLELALSVLQGSGNKQSVAIYQRMKDNHLKCFGVHIGKIEKIAKTIPKNNNLAYDLWETDYLEARLLACMLFEPGKISEIDITKIASRQDVWIVSYMLCSRLLPKIPNVQLHAYSWINSPNEHLRRCGFLTLGYASRSRKYSDEYYYQAIEIIQNTIQQEENFVKDAMNTALYNFGKRSKELGLIILDILKDIGEIKVDYGENSCSPINVKYHIERTLKSY